MATVAFLFYRNTPEEEGIAIDGNIINKTENNGPATVSIPAAYTRRMALRTFSFRAVVCGLAANAVVNTGLTFHIQAIGEEAGLSLAKAVAIFIPASFITVPLGFFAALLSERIPSKFYIVTMALAQLLTYVSVNVLNTPAGYVLTIIGLGVSGGFMAPLQTTIIPKLFGRLHLGSVNGVVVSITVIASAIGPFFFSLINDLVGSLRIGILLMSILPLLALFFAYQMHENLQKERKFGF